MAKRGYRVFASGRRADALDALRAEADDDNLSTVLLDVADPASITAAAEEIDSLTDGYGLDVLINNAGYGTVGPMEEMTPEDMQAQFETNVFGLLRVTQAFLPRMRERGSGRVVNISSVGGRITFPLFGAYNATKHAIESMSDAMRMELAPFGVEVVLIEPGAIATGFADRSAQEVSKYQRPDSPYAFVLDRSDEIKDMADRYAVGPEHITKLIERAIATRRPRARYMGPFGYRVLVALIRWLPASWGDWYLARMAGLTASHLSASRDQRPEATAAA